MPGVVFVPEQGASGEKLVDYRLLEDGPLRDEVEEVALATWRVSVAATRGASTCGSTTAAVRRCSR